jgi:hypothetical protein
MILPTITENVSQIEQKLIRLYYLMQYYLQQPITILIIYQDKL